MVSNCAALYAIFMKIDESAVSTHGVDKGLTTPHENSGARMSSAP
jgi:hypothetical protein